MLFFFVVVGCSSSSRYRCVFLYFHYYSPYIALFIFELLYAISTTCRIWQLPNSTRPAQLSEEAGTSFAKSPHLPWSKRRCQKSPPQSLIETSEGLTCKIYTIIVIIIILLLLLFAVLLFTPPPSFVITTIHYHYYHYHQQCQQQHHQQHQQHHHHIIINTITIVPSSKQVTISGSKDNVERAKWLITQVWGYSTINVIHLTPRVLSANRVDFELCLFHKFSNFTPRVMGCGAAESISLGFVCFFVINPLDFELFCFLNFPIITPILPPSPQRVFFIVFNPCVPQMQRVDSGISCFINCHLTQFHFPPPPLIWAFFFHKFSNFTPLPRQPTPSLTLDFLAEVSSTFQ